MGGTVIGLYSDPEIWDGSEKNMCWATYITIWCFEAPSTPFIVKCGSTDHKVPQSVNFNSGSDTSVVNEISGVGRYLVSGNCHIELDSGSGGLIYISGSQ